MSIDILRYLKMAAPEDPDTWFSVHRRKVVDGRDPFFPGNAHKKIRSALDDVKYWMVKGFCVYLSQGMYRNAGQQMGLYPKAERTYQNLVACKNLYMDIDVKAVGGYPSTAAAVAALQGFLKWSGLPAPTIIVGSGSGGLHVYWTLSIAFDRAEFGNMAGRLIAAGAEFGLLFDRQCTRDATRLLRVGGTWNQKHATDEIPATEVKLLYCGKEHIDIDLMKAGLSRFKATITHESKPSQASEDDDIEHLTGGDKREYAPVDINDVVTVCPFIKNTLETGGAGYAEPLWKYSLALAARCKEPEETAHRLSKGHAEYNPDATLQKLAQGHGAGPPFCATIAILATECATCPHRDLGTTPLGVPLKLKQPNGNAYHGFQAAAPTPGTGIELPYKYYLGADKLIYIETVDKGGANRDAVLAFEYEILSATLEAGKPFQFVLDTMQGERRVTKRFETTIVSDATSFARAFAFEGLPINVQPELSRKFVSSYIAQLQRKEDTLITAPAFGWSQDRHGDMGFAFAGEFVSPAGMARCAQPDAGTENYRVMGDEQVWCDLMKLIITPDRPDLACMVAASFAAPLVGMTGQPGLLMGVTSPASGIGKSTALLAGQSVWSSPIVGGLSDTVIYTFAKCATLRHLPVFYDEIKGDRQIKAMTEIAFQLTGGREKGRSDRSGKMRKINEFKTLCGYASNGSIVQGVREEDKGTDASWLRIFEMEAEVIPNISHSYASKVNDYLIGLQLNHGGIGRRYATYLGQNHKLIYTKLTNSQSKFAQALGADPKVERFWIAAIATTMIGATIANELGVVNFPLQEMGQFMFSEFRRMKQAMAEDPSDYTADAALLSTIGAFLNEKQPRNMIILDKTWMQPMKPPKGYATIRNEKNDSAWGKLDVQVSGDPLVLRISDSSLGEWCTRTKRPKHVFVTQLRKKVGARMSTGMIGSGSRLAGAKENVWVINATGTILEDYLEFTVHHKFLPP